ncbi:endonuclease/exonuclease/phosphatase family protein [Neorhizobium sp. CSC1952]|uniref:Metal-dependent hydrolase, endonuclease/exonuclease/phosphatase family n=1 Tax=Xaviernesmea oryzae TaxID=464029 RepID=A0A1X7CKZ7_9HYPH|nr:MULTISPECIES: endonuclease/exonuclease/phosphatase family protein [Rhizobium/Agrobacterium group]WJR69142.1 endonuclease/exonuclease/phosphatase family protein [Rhizobium sp. CSC1952]SME98667.1 Metal-dependent hydrolase, endonuclease/exonuclease/phosphatase family [Xaviernesmea oryzae]
MREKRPTLPISILTSIRARKNRGAGASEPHDRSKGMLIASYNVHKCVGIDGRFDPARTSHVIREIGADVIALQEADTRFGERRGLLDLAWMERETGLLPVPVSGVAKAHGWHGNVILFREGLVRDVHQVKLPGLEPRGALITELELEGGRTFRIIAAHLGLLNRSRHQQTRMILDILSSRDEQPTVLMGDLNEWRLGDRSSLNTLTTVFGLPTAVPSFPSRLPVLALDRIMANRPGLIDTVEAHDTPLARLASDHLPIKAVLKLRVLPAAQQSAAG